MTAGRPAYGSVLWALVAPVIATAVVLVAAGAGLLAIAGADPGRSSRSAPWVFPLDEPLGWLANAPLAVLGVALLTWLTRRCLPRGAAGERVALWPLAAVLAAAGAFATLPRGNEAEAGTAVVGWLAAAWLIRRLPWRPHDAPVPPRGRRLVPAAAIGAGVVALLPLPLTYADRNPLTVTSSKCASTARTTGCTLVDERRFGLNVSVRNTGAEPVVVTGVRLVGLDRGLRVERIRLIPRDGYARDLRLPQTLGSGRDLELEFRVRVARDACAALDGGPLATAVRVRASTGTQKLRLDRARLEPGECLTP